jgi:dienelactone hydrolase
MREPQADNACLAETYIARPQKPHSGKAVLILTDVIGHKLDNAQLIADQFAANGYLTIMPDLFHGDPISLNRPADFDMMKWLKGKEAGGDGPGHLPPRVEPLVTAALKHLKEKEGATRIATVGYCFGAKYVVLSLAKGYGADVGFVAHPSFVEADELKAIAGPLSIAAAGKSRPYEQMAS